MTAPFDAVKGLLLAAFILLFLVWVSSPAVLQRFGLATTEDRAATDLRPPAAVPPLVASSIEPMVPAAPANTHTMPVPPPLAGCVALSRVPARAFSDTTGVYSLAFSPDGETLAVGFVEGEISLWDVTTSRRTSILAENTGDDSSIVNSLTFSLDGTMLASGSGDKTVKLWDVASGQCLHTLTGHTSFVFDVAFSPDGGTLASASNDATIRLWNVATGQPVRTLAGHASWVSSVAFSADGNLLASGSWDRTVKLWDIAKGAVLQTLVCGDSVASVAFSPDGTLLAAGLNDHSITFWNAQTWNVVRTLHGHTSWVRSLAFSPDGKLLASASEDETIRLWCIGQGRNVATLSCVPRGVTAVAFSSDGTTVASASGGRVGGMVQLWDLSAASIAQLPAVLPVLPTPAPPKTVFRNRDVLLQLLEPQNGGATQRQIDDAVNEILERPLTVSTGATAYYTDGKIAVGFSVIKSVRYPGWDVVESRLSFSLSNLTSAPLVVIWDRCSMQLPAGGATNVMHSGQRYIARSEPTIPTTVVQGGVLSDEVIPSSVVYYSEISKEWTIPPGALDGGPFWFTLAVEVNGELKYYTFKFLVTYREVGGSP